MEVRTKLDRILEAADEAKAQEINTLDLRDKTTITDYFVLCSGTSDVHARSIADKIQERMEEVGEDVQRVEGYRHATWILLDYGDVVVHVMQEEQRRYYDLETFWQNLPLLENLREERGKR